MFGGFGFGVMRGGSFEAHYRAMPVAFIDKQQAEYGDKVILPPSALDRLASLHIEYPMLFKVDCPGTGRFTHCGVLEFVAEEGVVYMPHWMMQNLLLQVGDMVKLSNVSLPKGTYVKLQPVTSDFLDISNPKAVLERALRSYSCLTVGDVFVVNYNNRNYEIEVRDAKPSKAISVIETDCEVDFEAPKDYKEPEPVRPAAPPPPAAAPASGGAPGDGAAAQPEEEEAPKFQAFVGAARRLDGKPAAIGSGGGAPPASAAAAAALARLGSGASASSSQPPAGSGSGALSSTSVAASGTQKAGTLISNNRLADKLMREKAGAAGGVPPAAAAAAAAAPAAKPKEDAKEEPQAEEPKFAAFKGKAYSLK